MVLKSEGYWHPSIVVSETEPCLVHFGGRVGFATRIMMSRSKIDHTAWHMEIRVRAWVKELV
jgi:hypothetical protein